jgi:hypothetical protein
VAPIQSGVLIRRRDLDHRDIPVMHRTMCGHRKKVAICKVRSEAVEVSAANTLILDLVPASGTGRK